MIYKKGTLIDLVIDAIKLDVANGDTTALEEMLKHLPDNILEGYLPLKLSLAEARS
jgi:hypothetical protein